MWGLSNIKIGLEGANARRDAIMQNVYIIISTPKGSVPFRRDFGVGLDWIDNPSPRALLQFRADVITQIEKHEPRVIVDAISFGADADGKVFPQITLSILVDSV
jgi:hypothetical protein